MSPRATTWGEETKDEETVIAPGSEDTANPQIRGENVKIPCHKQYGEWIDGRHAVTHHDQDTSALLRAALASDCDRARPRIYMNCSNCQWKSYASLMKPGLSVWQATVTMETLEPARTDMVRIL